MCKYIYIYDFRCKPLAYKSIGRYVIICNFLPLETVSENMPFPSFSKNLQSGKVREGSGKGNGKGKQPRNRFYQKSRNPGRSGKVPGRETGREKPTLQKAAIREGPGRFRQVIREGSMSTSSLVSVRF